MLDLPNKRADLGKNPWWELRIRVLVKMYSNLKELEVNIKDNLL